MVTKADLQEFRHDMRRWAIRIGVFACALDLVAKAAVLTFVLRTTHGH